MLTPLYAHDVSELHKVDSLRAETCKSVIVWIKWC